MENTKLNKQNTLVDLEKVKKSFLPEHVATTWIESLATLTQHTSPSPETRTRTMINCGVVAGRRSMYIPPDMAELQPNSQRYLQTFAEAHALQLVEDQRRVTLQPIVEKRKQDSPSITKGMSELLRQLGLPGDIRPPSQPHRLAADSEHIDIEKLIQMAAFAAPEAKQVIVQPNAQLTDVLYNKHRAIKAHASRLISADTNTVLSHFESPDFHAIGYSTGKQYVLHLCLAGGSISNPCMWSEFHTMKSTDFRFQLFCASEAKNDFGIFYATQYLDLADLPAPWWLNGRLDSQIALNDECGSILLKRAS